MVYIDKITIVWEAEGSSSLTSVELSFPENNYTAKLGQTFNAPMLTVDPTAAASEVVYSSSNTDVATVDANGNVSLVAAGTTTITAEISGSETYYDATASYRLTVEEALPEGIVIDFKETFTDCDGTGGNDNQWSGSIASTSFDDSKADNANWTLVSGNTAYECIKLGTGSKQGSAQTPSIIVTPGTVYTLTFKAAAWNGNSESTNLKLSATGGTLSQASVTLVKGAWTTYTITFTASAETAKIKFEGNAASNSRFFLDEVVLKHEENTTPSTDPSITVTPNPLNIDDDGGIFTVSCANMPDHGLGVSVNSGSPSNAFSFTKTNDNTFNDDDKYFPLTGNANNKYDLESGTVQVNYTGHALSAAGVIKFESTPESTTADVKYLYDGDIYIVGDVVGSGWSTEGGTVHGVPLVKNADGTYSVTVTATAGGEGFTWLYFTKSLNASNYDDLGYNRFGPAGDYGSWSYNSGLNGVYCDLDTEGNLHTIKMAPGNYIFTIDPATNKFKIEEIVPINACPAVIEFASATSDSGDEFGTDLTSFLENVSSGSQYIQSINSTRAYAGVKGIKLSSSRYNGNITLNLKPLNGNGSWKTTKVIVNAIPYSATDGASFTLNDISSGELSDSFADYEFNLDGSEIGSITISAVKRIYVKSITIMHECGDEPVLEQVAIPTFSPAAGSYNEVTDVTINCATAGATIYYTTDGTEPTSLSAVYGEPIRLTTTTTIKAIAMKGGMENSTVASAEYTLPQSVSTIAQALELKDNFIFTGNAVVTFHNSNHLYVRDETGSGLLYQVSAEEHKYNNGDVLTPNWSAGYFLYQDYTPQFSSPKNVGSTINNGAVAPEILTGLTVDDVNKFAGFNNVTITRSEEQSGKMNYYCSVGESKQEVCLRAAYTDLVASLIEGKTYNVTGVVTVYNDNPQLNLISATIVKQDLTLGFDPATVDPYVGQAFTAPALTGVPEGETIDVTYTSDNTNVATVVDNVVTLVEGATGTAIITATFAGNDYYNPTTATYTITVKPKENVTLSFGENPDVELYVGETFTAPKLTTNPEGLDVTYTVTNNNPEVEVAKINEEGEVELTGKAGTATVTATYAGNNQYNEASASYNITVKAKENVTLSFGENPDVELYVGETFTAPTLTTNPEGLEVTYTVTNIDPEVEVAKINEDGAVELTGKAGSATVTATYAGNNQYNEASASYNITVKAKENVTLSFGENPDVELYVGETFTAPKLTTNPEGLDVTYTVTNNNPEVEVAKINEEGEVELTGKAGTATVTATYAGNNQYNEASASYNITIKAKENVTLSFGENPDVELTIGDDFTAPTLTGVPEGGKVTYKSSDPNVATVDASGNVTIVGIGEAEITATYEGDNQYNSATASYTITVNDVEVALAAPTFAPAAGTYTEPKKVAIACATPGVTITYAIDGVDKGEYNGPFTISDGEHTVTATAKMGTRTVYTPATSSATYKINAASAATIADDYYSLQSNAAEVSGKYANVAGRRTLNFVAAADADKQAGTVFRIETGEGGAVKTLRSQAVDLQGYANRAMAYVPKAIELVLSTLANSSLGDPETPGTGILGENGLDLILNKFYEGFDYNLYVEQGTEGTYRIYGRTPSMQHVVDFYHENTAQVEEKLPMLEGYINQVLDKIRSKIPAPYDANVVVPFSLKTVRDRIADKYGIALIDPTQDLMGFYRQVLNNKEYVWDFAYQTAMMYVDVIKQTGTYQGLPNEYKLFVEKMEKVRPDTKYYIIERGNELDYISENNGEIISNDPRTLWTLTKRENFTVNVPEANKLNDSYYTTLYTDFAYTLPEGVTAYAVTDIDDNDVAQLAELSSPIAAQTPVLLKANAAGTVNVTLTTAAGNTPETNLLEGPDYLVKTYGITSPTVEMLFNMAAGFVPAETLADYEYLKLRTSGTVNNKYFWNVNDALDKCTYKDANNEDDCVVRSLVVKDGTLAFSEHWKTETNKAFLVSDTKPVIYLEKETLAAPTFSPVPGSYTVDNGQNVTITITAEDDATIYYKIGDGEYQRYNGPITASDDMTIMAKAEKDGMIASNEVTAVYVIDIPAELPDVPVMKGYFQIMNNGNEKYAHVQGRKTLTFTDAPADKAGTVIWLETNEKGQVQSLRSQAADLQRYADRAMSYVPEIVELVADKLNADGESNLLGHEGLEKIMEKFNKSFDHHLYVEQAGEGWRLFGKTPSMQPVVEFYRENTAQVEAKLPMLESFINSALNKLKEKIGGQSVFTEFKLHDIWQKMGGTLTEPNDDASTMAFYREVLNNKNYVWDFAYQTAMIYVNNLITHDRWSEVEEYLGEYAQYIDKIDQIRPDFKYYVVQENDKPDFISEGNVDIKNNAPRTIWTVEPRTTFTVNIADNLFGCPLAGVGGYATTLYTDFAYTVPNGVTAYKVTSIDGGKATIEALSDVIPAQTPVLLTAKEAGTVTLTLSTEAGTAVTCNLLVGPDYLINEYDLKTTQVQELFDKIKEMLGQDFYDAYVAQYEHLADLNSGTVNNKYFWSVDNYLDDLQDDCVVRSLATDENGKLAFSEHWKTETNKAFLVSDTFDVITLPSLERGDVNHDGYVNLLDVADLIDRLLVIPDAEHLKACPYCSDVDGNGSVSIKDVTVLIDILLENPAPNPEEGDGN